MKRVITLSFLLTVFFSYTVIAQELGSIRKAHEIKIPEKIHNLVLDPLPAGTYSVGTGGYFPTIDSHLTNSALTELQVKLLLN